ncbi:hypothetical protein BDZ89DRAFT_1033348 [Hymenopellis radicata]|nr:hypothetical protein BDZ89DRAFT_1033348 [Hymenopellis radicata]
MVKSAMCLGPCGDTSARISKSTEETSSGTHSSPTTSNGLNTLLKMNERLSLRQDDSFTLAYAVFAHHGTRYSKRAMAPTLFSFSEDDKRERTSTGNMNEHTATTSDSYNDEHQHSVNREILVAAVLLQIYSINNGTREPNNATRQERGVQPQHRRDEGEMGLSTRLRH